MDETSDRLVIGVWWRRRLPAFLRYGSPFVTAAATVAGLTAAAATLPKRSALFSVAIWVIPIINLGFAIGGATAGGLLTRGTASGRVLRGIACGFAGIFCHAIAVLLCIAVATLVVGAAG